jgi:hypothetical protein
VRTKAVIDCFLFHPWVVEEGTGGDSRGIKLDLIGFHDPSRPADGEENKAHYSQCARRCINEELQLKRKIKNDREE